MQHTTALFFICSHACSASSKHANTSAKISFKPHYRLDMDKDTLYLVPLCLGNTSQLPQSLVTNPNHQKLTPCKKTTMEDPVFRSFKDVNKSLSKLV